MTDDAATDCNGVLSRNNMTPDTALPLTAEERLLVTARSLLYENSWDRLQEDLRRRLAGQPYIFKLSGPPERDLLLSEKLRTYEIQHGIELTGDGEGESA